MPNAPNRNPATRESELQQIIDFRAECYDHRWLDDFQLAVKDPTMWTHISGIRVANLATRLDQVGQVSAASVVSSSSEYRKRGCPLAGPVEGRSE